MNHHFATLFSWILHPVLIPIYSLGIVLYSYPYHYQYIPSNTWNITLITLFLMTILFPALIILIMKKLQIVNDYDISEQKQRIFPYLIYVFFYLLSFLTFKPKEIASVVFMEDPLIATILLGATLSLMIGFFLNNFIKVSMHTNGCANLFAFACLLSHFTQKNLFILILISLVLVGLVGSSRIFLRMHTPREVYYGFFCGLVGQSLSFLFYFSEMYGTR